MVDSIRSDFYQVIVGLDIGDKFSTILVLNRDGEILDEGRVRTTAEALTARFQGLPRARVAIEVGTHSPWVWKLLEECGHEVLVANSRKLRLIYENDKKSDKVDAEYLARLARFDPKLLSPIQHRGLEAQQDIAVVRARDTLVKTRTVLINTIRGSVKSIGERIPSSSAHNFHKKIADSIPEELRPALTPLLETIEEVTTRINALDNRIEDLCETKYPQTKALMSVTGVGPLTALAYALVIGNPARFKKGRDVGPYLGLVPRRQESGDLQPQLRITKSGDKLMRRLLVGSAHYILGPLNKVDSDLLRHGEAIAGRGGKNAKKRAAVAVARKLAVLLHRLWVSGEEYEPLRNSKRRPRTKRHTPAQAPATR
jgi:transposase